MREGDTKEGGTYLHFFYMIECWLDVSAESKLLIFVKCAFLVIEK